MDYVTKSQVEQYTGLQIDDSLDAFLDLVSGFGKDYIDRTLSMDGARRWFDDADAESTRYFDGKGTARLYLDDCRSISLIVASITRGNGVTLVANEDYYLYPLNADTDGRPFEYVDLANPAFNLPANSRLSVFAGGNAYVFFEGQRNIAVTGKWGYNASGDGNIPKLVQMAMLKLITSVIRQNIGDADLKEVTAESLGEYSATYAKISEVADSLKIGDMLASLQRERVQNGAATRLAH